MYVGMKQSGVRKAATLFVTLGENATKSIFPHLNDEEIQEISREIALMDRATAEDSLAVLEEFRQLALARNATAQGGVDYAKNILRQSLPSERANDIMERLTKHLEQGPGFANMRKADPKLLVEIIQKEHPQTIAFILWHLDAVKAANAILSLPSELQVEVVQRMANLEQIRPEVVEKVSAALNEKLVAMSDANISVDGAKTVAEVLNRMGRTEARTLLKRMERKDPELTADIRQRMFAFDDIQSLPDRGIQEILKRAGKKQLTVALKGARTELHEKFFKNMSSRAEEALKDELSFLGPVHVSSVTEAQTTITGIVRQLEEEGIISIAGAADELYIA